MNTPQKAALEGLEDTSLVKDYPPLDWSRFTNKANNDQKQIDD